MKIGAFAYTTSWQVNKDCSFRSDRLSRTSGGTVKIKGVKRADGKVHCATPEDKALVDAYRNDRGDAYRNRGATKALEEFIGTSLTNTCGLMNEGYFECFGATSTWYPHTHTKTTPRQQGATFTQ